MGAVTVEIAGEGDHLIVRYGKDEVHRLRYQGDEVFIQDDRLAHLQFREQGGCVEGFDLVRYGTPLARAIRVSGK